MMAGDEALENPRNNKIVFRVDQSPIIGTGHLMRCLTLANMLSLHQVECVFLSRHLDPPFERFITQNGHSVVRLMAHENQIESSSESYAKWLGTSETQDSNDTIASLINIRQSSRIMAVLVDHYAIGERWHKCLRASYSGLIVAIDDLTRSHDVDLLLDTTYGRMEQAYKEHVPTECTLLCGSHFALLRPDFADQRPTSLSRHDATYRDQQPVQHILISMGGSDVGNATSFFADALLSIADDYDFTITALVGSSFQHQEALERVASQAQENRLTIMQHTNNVAELLGTADVCIGASGASTWERCCLGLPTINIVLADNQRTIDETLTQAGAIAQGGEFIPDKNSSHVVMNGEPLNSSDWANAVVRPVINNTEHREQLSKTSRNMVDGHGTARVVGTILALSLKNTPVTLRRATSSDIALVYGWQCFPKTRTYSDVSTAPTWKEHHAWMTRRLADEQCYFYIACCDDVPVGLVRLDETRAPSPPISNGTTDHDISILTAPNLYGCGIGGQMLLALKELHQDKVLIARVLAENESSNRLFIRAGFWCYQPEYYVWSHDAALKRNLG